MSPWSIELMVVRKQTFEGERRALARDADRGMLLRVRPGVYVERIAYESFEATGRHIVMMRALAAVSAAPPVFSHWSAAVLLGLPCNGDHLDRVHIVVADPAQRGLVGVFAHVGALRAGERVAVATLLSTGSARTVLDVALASDFASGVVIADGALHKGLPRDVLEEAVRAAGARRGSRKALQVASFAQGGAESAAESESRVTMMRLGVRPPVLQFEVRDHRGPIGRLDTWFPWVRVGGEVDGEKKYRDAELAPRGPADAVIREKRREDRLRRQVDGLARWGYWDARDERRLGPILAASGVLPNVPRCTLADYCTPFLHERLA